MSRQVQQQTTLCLQTKDAVEVEKGCFEFELKGAAIRDRAFRVSLGSIEFPITQFNVEPEWSRLYIKESTSILDALKFTITEKTAMGELSADIYVPSTINEITEFKKIDNKYRIKCKKPIGLFGDDAIVIVVDPYQNKWLKQIVDKLIDDGELSEDEKILLLTNGYAKTVGNANSSILKDFWWDSPSIVGTFGKISLSDSIVQPVIGDPYSIDLKLTSDVSFKDAWMYCPPPPSPAELAILISKQLRIAALECKWTCEFDKKLNTITLACETFPAIGNTLQVSVYGNLCKHLSIPERDITYKRDDALPLVVSKSTHYNWDFVQLPSGWYTPCHRPMANGIQPNHICKGLDAQLNGILLMPQREVPQGKPSNYTWTWIDPLGMSHTIEILNGKYSHETMATVLENAMSSTNSGKSSISVTFSNFKFRFECEYRNPITNLIESQKFGINLSSATSIPGHYLGLNNELYVDCSYYESHVQIPGIRSLQDKYVKSSNIYKSTLLPETGFISIGYSPISLVNCVILNTFENGIVASPYIAQQPFYMDIPHGTLIYISALKKETSLLVQSTSSWTLTSVSNANIDFTIGYITKCENGKLYIRLSDTVNFEVNKCISVSFTTTPYSLCFDNQLSNSLSGSHLGFDQGVTLWGDTLKNYKHTGPIHAKYIHNLDHPDYILIYIQQPSNVNTSLIHVNANDSSRPLAKIILYPLFRHERNVPSDAILASGESITRFRLLFRNPNGLPYNFHGANFSISLNLLFSESE